MNFISSILIPIVVLIVVIYGIFKKVNVYDVFIEGSKESFDMVLKIFPTMLAMVIAVNILLESNIINTVFSVFNSLSFIPKEILPMAVMRPISGTSSLAVLTNIFEVFGPDSYIGMLGSIIQGSTDTTFYVVTLYFGSVGIKRIRYALWAGLAADLVGIIVSIMLANMLF